ncbi:MAG: SRPBCC family protein [Candidatus Limnocylindrales bacterium]
MSETIHVDRSPEVVFDYTQDYATRTDWDDTIKRAEVLSDEPRRVRITAPGLGTFTLEYRLFRRGDRTSAAFADLENAFFSGGGGSWRYEPRDGGTDWTESNTLELRRPRLLGWLAPMVAWNLRNGTRRAMAKAKGILESRPPG